MATLIMYCEERVKAGEMRYVQVALKTAVVPVAGDMVRADTLLKKWGRVIKQQFRLDNLSLLTRDSHSDTEQLKQVVRDLGDTVSELSGEVCAVRVDMRNLSVFVHSSFTDIRSLLREFVTAQSRPFYSAPPGIPPPLPPPLMFV